MDSDNQPLAPPVNRLGRFGAWPAWRLWGLDYRLGFKLAGPTGAVILGRGGQTLLAFLLARSLGVSGYGEFVFALGAATVLGQFADFGWPFVINREMPRHIREQSWSLLRGLNRAADATVLLFSLCCAAGLVTASLFFPHYALGLQMAALMVTPLAFIFMRQQQLAAVDRATVGMLLDQGAAATIVLIIHLLHPTGTKGTLETYAAVLGLVVVAASIVFRSRLPLQIRGVKAEYRLREWLTSGRAMFGALVPRILVTRFDVLMVAPLAGLYQAGLFGSALRLTVLMTFPQFILQTLVMPRFSRAFAHNDLAKVRRLFWLSMLFALVTAAPFLVPIVVAPSFVMTTFFGSEFAVGGTTLFWLGMGEFIAAFGIPLNAMIAMGGNHKAMGRQGMLILMATFVGGFLIVPRYGAAGAAILATLATCALTAGMVWLAMPLFRAGSVRERVGS